MHSGSARLGPENAADLRDMFAFLKTLPEVEGRARSHDLRILFTIRRGLGLWKLLYLDGQAFAADTAKSASWNRGSVRPGEPSAVHFVLLSLLGVVAMGPMCASTAR